MGFQTNGPSMGFHPATLRTRLFFLHSPFFSSKYIGNWRKLWLVFRIFISLAWNDADRTRGGAESIRPVNWPVNGAERQRLPIGLLFPCLVESASTFVSAIALEFIFAGRNLPLWSHGILTGRVVVLSSASQTYCGNVHKFNCWAGHRHCSNHINASSRLK